MHSLAIARILLAAYIRVSKRRERREPFV